MVLSVAHIREEERGSERRLGVTRYAAAFFFFCFLQAFTVFAGEAGGCSQLLKKATTIGCK